MDGIPGARLFTHQRQDAKKIVLYPAHHGENERTRKEILDDLNLDIDDYDLEKKLHKLVKADIIAGDRSNYDYKGLGDPIFAMVIRKKYQQEIDQAGSRGHHVPRQQQALQLEFFNRTCSTCSCFYGRCRARTFSRCLFQDPGRWASSLFFEKYFEPLPSDRGPTY
ncbi:MAG: hypothetical protein QNK37_11290 [Acidobacteriota bacterium]|nr:hypothetical protein [Acidobacteriota bacterium]